MHVQLWSYNYSPEPTGIGPVSTVLAEGLRDRGHDVDVVAAHPHYPEASWGSRRLPYREERNGISVLRLPLWVGRATARERYRQELTYMAAQLAALPPLGRPDVAVSVSPSFPALLPAMLNARLRRLSWVLWLQDILPDGAASTGLVDSGRVIEAARALERRAYREADLIVVPSRAFTSNLVRKGVPEDKIRLIYNCATRTPRDARSASGESGLRILSMGNIGASQGLGPLIEAFENARSVRENDVRLVITGSGVAAEDVRRRVASDRVQMLGLVDSERLEAELRRADVGLVSQRHGGEEFNIPSKLMNFMAYGLPVLAAVSPAGEVARLIEDSGGGWVIDSARPESLADGIAGLVDRPHERRDRSRAAQHYAAQTFSRASFAERFERSITEGIERSRDAPSSRRRPGTRA